MQIERFEDLIAWTEARALVTLVYRLTKEFVREDRDLVRQMRRAGVSVMSNIAEGFSKYTLRDSKQFYIISRGSLAELRSQMYVAIDQGYLSGEDMRKLEGSIETVGKLISGLIRNTQRRLELVAIDRTGFERHNH